MAAAKTAFITGANGFIGVNLVKRLLDAGWTVVAFHRSEQNVDLLRGFPHQEERLRFAKGDVLDVPSLEAAMPEDVDAVFHIAADLSQWKPLAERQHRINVEGTANVVRTCIAKRAKRLVHTSTNAVYLPPAGQDYYNEETPYHPEGFWHGYVRTKMGAEREVDKGVAQGLDAVVVQPGDVVGRYDTANWAQVFQMLTKGALPAVPKGNLSAVAVDDVTASMVAAYEKGRKGERYLVAGTCIPFRAVVHHAAQLLGKPTPREAPAWVVKSLAWCQNAVSWSEPDLTPEKAYLTTTVWRADCAKAVRELGHTVTDEEGVKKAIEESYRWLKETGKL